MSAVVPGNERPSVPSFPACLQPSRAICPALPLLVGPEQASCKSEYQGRTYYFCSFQCKQLFDAEPREYVAS
jgi:YHS domain-containing protein